MHITVYYKGEQFRSIFRAIIRPVHHNSRILILICLPHFLLIIDYICILIYSFLHVLRDYVYFILNFFPYPMHSYEILYIDVRFL